MTQMDRAALEGVELEYETRGAGEAVMLIHPGHFADWFVPLLNEPALTDRYRVVNYHRVGCAGSSNMAGPVSFALQAAHCRSLMRYLGIERAHIVGHSSGGMVALQMPLDAPDMVQSLALLEPALRSVPSQKSRAFIGAAHQRYLAGDKAGAVDTFLRGTCGPDYRTVLDRVLPDSFAQSVTDADTYFGKELPAMQEWVFTREEARRITQPVLAVVGEKSRTMDPIWDERQKLLLDWLPNAEPFVAPGATHLLQLENPRGIAEGLTAFFARHPFRKSSVR